MYLMVAQSENGMALRYYADSAELLAGRTTAEMQGFKVEIYKPFDIEDRGPFNLIGNPIDGFSLIGPFDDDQKAIDWQESCDETCWLIDANKP